MKATKGSPTYSICITHYNNRLTLSRALTSIIEQIDGQFEVVVVDQCSTDGSLKILQEYEQKDLIRLFSQAVRNRGLGRQHAFEMSRGQYIISHIDMDDVYSPVLANILNLYKLRCDGMMLHLHSADSKMPGGAVTIAPRLLLEEIGGWRSLQWFEDRDLWVRALRLGKYRWTSFPFYQGLNPHRERKSLPQRTLWSVRRRRDAFRIGLSEQRTPWGKIRGFPLTLAAWLSSRRLPSYHEDGTLLPSLKSKAFYVDFGQGEP